MRDLYKVIERVRHRVGRIGSRKGLPFKSTFHAVAITSSPELVDMTGLRRCCVKLRFPDAAAM